MGDLNAQIGRDRSGFEQVLGPHACVKCMDNSNHFVNFFAMNDLKIGSFIFQHKDIHKIIWVSNDHMTATQIDHLAVEPIWRTSCLQDIKVHCGSEICNDHRPLIAKMEIKLKRLKEGSQVIR